MENNTEISKPDIFVNSILKVLGQNADYKNRYIRANEAPFMKKDIKKATLKKLLLENG